MSRRAVEAPPAPEPLGLASLLDDHLGYLASRNYSPHTVRNRRSHLGQFCRWCEERGIVRPGEVTRAVVERYRQWLFHYRKDNGRPLSWSSQSQKLQAVKVYLRYLVRIHLIPFNPAAELELPRQPKRLPAAVLSVAEAEQVLSVPDVAEPLGLRDRAILETLYSTGMRRMEVVGLSLYDLDLERATVRIRGKGQKERTVPIGARALGWIERYATEARPALVVPPDDGRLFLNSRGRPFTPKRMTMLCRRHVEASGVGKEGSCHIFRHTAATLMLERGADLRFIQELLGHESLSTTQVYTRVSITQLKAVHERTHPGARVGRSDVTEASRAELLAALLDEEDVESDEEDEAAGDGAGEDEED